MAGEKNKTGLNRILKNVDKIGNDDDNGISDVSSRKYKQWGPKPPDGGWGWVVVCSVFTVHLTVDGTYYVFGILLPEFVETFQCSQATASWVGSLQVALAHVLGNLCCII